MNIPEYLGKGLAIVMLRGRTAALVAMDPKALGPGLLFVAVAGSLSTVFEGQLGFATIAAGIFSIIGTAILAGLLHFAATRIFKGRGSYGGLFRAVALGSVLSWVVSIPYVGTLAALWMLAVLVVIAEHVYGLTRGKAIGAVGVAVGVLLLLGVVATFILATLISGPF